jgi:hypothetical protein
MMRRTSDIISVLVIKYEYKLRVIFKLVYKDITNQMASFNPGQEYHAFQNRLSFHLLPKNRKIKIHTIASSGGTRWRRWLSYCASSRKVAGSIPDGVIDIIL